MDKELKPTKNAHKDGHSIYFTLSLLLLAVIIVMGAYMFYQSNLDELKLSMALREVDSLSEKVDELNSQEQSEKETIEELKNDYQGLKEELEKKEEEEKTAQIAGWTTIGPDDFSGTSSSELADLSYSYPDNWDFSCCSEGDAFLEHFIYSPSYDQGEAEPYIAIRDYSIPGEPRDLYENLLEGLGDLAFEEFDQESIGASGVEYTDPMTESRQFLFYTDTAVIKVIFYEYDKLGSRFIFDFMEMLRPGGTR